MIDRRMLHKTLMASLIISCTISLSGCSLTSVFDRMRDPEKLSAELHESPRFWNDVTPYSAEKGLYVLFNEYFKRKPFNNLMPLGDNILLIGQGSYLEDVNDLVSEYKDKEFEYSFALYNPWSNDIIAELNHNDITCDEYQIVGDRLFLSNNKKNTIDVYDSNLNFTERYNFSKFGDVTNFKIYPTEDTQIVFLYNYVDRSGLMVNLDDLSTEECDFGVYEPNLEAVSSDGSSILVSGIDKKSLQYVLVSFNSKTKARTNCVRGQSYLFSDISANTILTDTNITSNEWIYQNSDSSEDLHFSIENIRSSKILPDGSFILQQEDAYGEDSDSHDITYYHIDKDGNILSSFTFDCGNPNMAGYTYFSYNYVYLEEANCIMFLNYTTEVNPYVLVWDLSAVKEDDLKTIDILKDEDTNNIDLGSLAKINEYANELEDKYSINIFIGNEVPDEIDVFKTSKLEDASTVEASLQNIDRLFSCYPKDFWSQLCYSDIMDVNLYLSGSITSSSDETIDAASGFVTISDSHIIIVLDATLDWDWDYTVNHELSHIIDRRLEFKSQYDKESIFSEEKWGKLNPPSFSYMNSYTGYATNPDYQKYSAYFVDAYGTTYPTEDRAEIFGKAMEDYLNDINDNKLFREDSIPLEKLAYYSKCIRDGFDTTGWEKKLPWENYVK